SEMDCRGCRCAVVFRATCIWRRSHERRQRVSRARSRRLYTPGKDHRRPMTEFRSRVLSVVRRIPPGRVATYGDIAALAGKPRASRAVGNIMRNARELGVPYHRVIAAGGALGGYGGNLQVKRELLRAEGVEVGIGRVRAFE